MLNVAFLVKKNRHKFIEITPLTQMKRSIYFALRCYFFFEIFHVIHAICERYLFTQFDLLSWKICTTTQMIIKWKRKNMFSLCEWMNVRTAHEACKSHNDNKYLLILVANQVYEAHRLTQKLWPPTRVIESKQTYRRPHQAEISHSRLNSKNSAIRRRKKAAAACVCQPKLKPSQTAVVVAVHFESNINGPKRWGLWLFHLRFKYLVHW